MQPGPVAVQHGLDCLKGESDDGLAHAHLDAKHPDEAEQGLARVVAVGCTAPGGLQAVDLITLQRALD